MPQWRVGEGGRNEEGEEVEEAYGRGRIIQGFCRGREQVVPPRQWGTVAVVIVVVVRGGVIYLPDAEGTLGYLREECIAKVERKR